MFLKFDENVCRVCLNQLGSVNLFDQEQNIEKFSFVTFLEVSKDDGLPHSLCIKCSACLKVAYNFKSQAIASDNQLKSYLKTINNSFSTFQTNNDKFNELDKELAELNSWLPVNERITMEDFEIMLCEENETTKSERTEIKVKNEIEFHVIVDSDQNVQIDSRQKCNSNFNFEMISETPDEYTITNFDEVNLAKNKTDPETPINKAIRSTRKKEYITRKTNNKIVNDLFQCDMCENTFTKEINLHRHMELHKSNREGHKCSICGKLFTQLSSVRQHLLIHTGERPHPCPECPKSFRRKKTLVTHLLSHTKEKPFQCTHCTYKFASKQALKHHSFRLHEDNKQETVTYNCKECDKVYYTKYSLNEHFNNVHETVTSKCSVCSKIFYTKKSYSEHIKTHGDINECTVCKERFRSLKELKQHMEIHESNEEHKCKHCNQVFGRKYKLILHMQTHADSDIIIENEYKCGKCENFQSNQIDEMYKHLSEKHPEDDENFFKCFDCEGNFSTKDELFKHVQTHKKPNCPIIFCDACDLKFSEYQIYFDHMIENHRNSYQCNICDENLGKLSIEDIIKHRMDHNIVILTN